MLQLSGGARSVDYSLESVEDGRGGLARNGGAKDASELKFGGRLIPV
jgi:hypothetical protein